MRPVGARTSAGAQLEVDDVELPLELPPLELPPLEPLLLEPPPLEPPPLEPLLLEPLLAPAAGVLGVELESLAGVEAEPSLDRESVR